MQGQGFIPGGIAGSTLSLKQCITVIKATKLRKLRLNSTEPLKINRHPTFFSALNVPRLKHWKEVLAEAEAEAEAERHRKIQRKRQRVRDRQRQTETDRNTEIDRDRDRE